MVWARIGVLTAESFQNSSITLLFPLLPHAGHVFGNDGNVSPDDIGTFATKVIPAFGNGFAGSCISPSCGLNPTFSNLNSIFCLEPSTSLLCVQAATAVSVFGQYHLY